MADKIRVLFLTSWYPSLLHPLNGIFIKKDVEAVARFCDVAVLYVTLDPALMHRELEIEQAVEDGIFTVRVYYRHVPKAIPLLLNGVKARYLRATLGGLDVLKRHFGKPDLIHANIALPAGLAALMLKYIARIPYILTEHYDLALRHHKNLQRFGLLDRFITGRITKEAAYVTVNSMAMWRAMKELGLKGNYRVIYVVADVENLQGYPIRTCEDARSRKKKAIHISLLSDKQKNVSGIINAIARIWHSGRRDIDFHIIGDGSDRSKLERLAEKHGVLNECIHFHGYVTEQEKVRLLTSSDFHILNSNFEGFSVATAEALMCGIPVIATRCGGPEDFVTDEVGILIDSLREDKLVEAILYMLDNSHLYDRQVLRNYAQKMFNSDVIGRQFYALYQSMLARVPAK